LILRKTEFLAENRKSMSNDEMKKFLEQESELQKNYRKIETIGKALPDGKKD